MSARERILGRIRRTGEGRADPAAVAARLAAPGQTAPVPAASLSEGAARTEQFIQKARAADATVSRIDSVEALPRALAEELRARNLPAAIRTGTDPALTRVLAADSAGLEHSTGTGRLEEPATLSRAPFAMAETGTLLLESGPDNPVTLTFLGETHFVLVEESDICAGFEEMWARWRSAGGDPRTVNLVTGPSRSADIGQTLQLGAHGPVALHVFVCGPNLGS
ncbi:MAG: lactate utilization protein [Pseudomonadota bacterium]